MHKMVELNESLIAILKTWLLESDNEETLVMRAAALCYIKDLEDKLEKK